MTHSKFQQPDNPNIEHLTERNIRSVFEIEEQTTGSKGIADRAADLGVAICGSKGFIVLHIFWFTGWILANIILFTSNPFDPYPFQLLNLFVALESILLSGLLLISQNRQAALSERRNQLALQINLLAEQETSKILHIIEKIANRLDVSLDDLEIEGLKQFTEIRKLNEQIDEVNREK